MNRVQSLKKCSKTQEVPTARVSVKRAENTPKSAVFGSAPIFICTFLGVQPPITARCVFPPLFSPYMVIQS